MPALATKKAKSSAPTFRTTAEVWTDVDVDIDPEELEEAGWVYVGKDNAPSTSRVLDVVQRWHNDNHDGPFRWCTHALCDELRGRDGA